MSATTMSYIISAFSLISLWLIGNKNRWGWVVGILNQILWTIYAIKLQQWGLLIGVVAYTIINIRNFIKWTGLPRAHVHKEQIKRGDDPFLDWIGYTDGDEN